MSASAFRKIVKTIMGDDALRRIALASVKIEVDDIYGYSKYSLKEMSWDFESRLYSMTYLARSIVGIIGEDEVPQGVKKNLCHSYLGFLRPYVEGNLPKPVYDWRSEPSYTLEMAVFLDSVGELDWGDFELLDLIVYFGKDSCVESKGEFTLLFVDHLNKDKKMFHYYSSGRGEGLEGSTDTLSFFGVFFKDSYPEEMTRSTFNILRYLGRMISSGSSGKNVSLKPLGELDFLTPGDINWIMDHIILFGVPNRVKSCEDLYGVLFEKGEDVNSSFHSLVSQVREGADSYVMEPKIKGFLNAATRLPVDEVRLVEMASTLLDLGISVSAKLWIYKLVFKVGGNRKILERAKKENSKTIRKWAAKASKSTKP
jgi:hypothetical protein